MKKILVVVGSSIKDGNTDRLAKAFIQGASEAGNEVQEVMLGNLQINGCRGCGACQKTGKCIISDDMQQLYPMFHEANIIVFASPLYFWTISAQTKAFIDRLYAISKEDIYPFKETVLLMSAGSDDFYAFEQVVSFYRFYTKALGWQDKGMVLAGGCNGEPSQRHIDEKYLREAFILGNTIE